MDGKLVLGMNPYKEICTLHLAGKMIIDKVLFHIASMRLRSNRCYSQNNTIILDSDVALMYCRHSSLVLHIKQSIMRRTLPIG